MWHSVTNKHSSNCWYDFLLYKKKNLCPCVIELSCPFPQKKKYSYLLVQCRHCPFWPLLLWSLCTLLLLCYPLSVNQSCRESDIWSYKFSVHFPLHRFWRIHPRLTSYVELCITCYLFCEEFRITLFNTHAGGPPQFVTVCHAVVIANLLQYRSKLHWQGCY
jgi:hypothetical protein